jgi:hypothetical protein
LAIGYRFEFFQSKKGCQVEVGSPFFMRWRNISVARQFVGRYLGKLGMKERKAPAGCRPGGAFWFCSNFWAVFVVLFFNNSSKMTVQLNFDKINQQRLMPLLDWLREIGLVKSYQVADSAAIDGEVFLNQMLENAEKDIVEGNLMSSEEVTQNLENWLKERK